MDNTLFDFTEEEFFTCFENKALVSLEGNCLSSFELTENDFDLEAEFSPAAASMPIDIPKAHSFDQDRQALNSTPCALTLIPSVLSTSSSIYTPSFNNLPSSPFSEDLAAWFDELAVRSPSAGSLYSTRSSSPNHFLTSSPLLQDPSRYLSPSSCFLPLIPSDACQESNELFNLFPSVSQPESQKKKAKRGPIHTCPYCNHTSNRANNMREHIQIHNPDRPRPFSCDICSRAFARKHDMKRHFLSCKKKQCK